MKELIRTNDTVFISYLTHRLREESIEPFELDIHTSVVEGSLGILPKRIMVADEQFVEGSLGILPKRIMVADEQFDDARKILDEAQGSEIR